MLKTSNFAAWIPEPLAKLQCYCCKILFLFLDIDDCVGVSCGDGTCVDGIASHTCSCDVGFTGDSCETSKLHNHCVFLDMFKTTCTTGSHENCTLIKSSCHLKSFAEPCMR